MAISTPTYERKTIYYDRVRKRLWIRGQRCHHGATGMILTFWGAMGIGLLAQDGTARAGWFGRGWHSDD